MLGLHTIILHGLGMLLVGIAFGNIGFLRETLVINSSWNVFVRQVAFILIVIRCGLGVDPEALRQSLVRQS